MGGNMKTNLIFPCLRGVIGDWVYYSTLMTAEQISKSIRTAKQIREAKSLEDFLQRKLKERKYKIANYLLGEKTHFFNSIIAGVFGGIPDWYEFDLNKNDQLMQEIENPEYIEMSMGILKFTGDEKIFAVDGQHRVEAIKIALEQDKSKPNGRVLNDDQYSVIFIAHIDDDKGKKRTRKLFSDINKRAVPVSLGDKVIIDEEDLSAIVARRIYAKYPHFQSGKIISLTENARLEDNDYINFTNLLALYTVNQKLRSLHRKAKNVDSLSEANIAGFTKVAWKFYDFVIENIKEYNDFFISKKLALQKLRRNNSHLLFRPIGLILLARLYVYFAKTQKLQYLRSNINKIDFNLPGKHFDKVVWNNGKMEAKSANQVLAYELSLYLLDHLSEEKYEEFKERFETITKGSRSIPSKVI